MVEKPKVYDEQMLTIIEWFDAVRKCPGMYVGNCHDGSGRDHVIWGVVGNAIDQHLMRRARSLWVDVADGWVTVEDDGPGFPVASIHGMSAIEAVFTRLMVGARHAPHVHVSQLGAGLAPVNALSERLEVESRSEGQAWRIVFEKGPVVEPLTSLGPSDKWGARLRFLPDRRIFAESPALDGAAIERRLRELAWMNPLLDVRFNGRRLPSRGGIAAWVREIAGGLVEDSVVTSTRVVDDVLVDLAFGWHTGEARAPEVRSFVGQRATPRGGTHVRGKELPVRVDLSQSTGDIGLVG